MPRVGTINQSLPPDASVAEGREFASSWVGTFTLEEGTLLPDSNLVLARPLTVAIEITPQGILIQSGWVDEDGYGIDFRHAYEDFLTSLQDRLDSLTEREERLSSADRDILNRLRALLGVEK